MRYSYLALLVILLSFVHLAYSQPECDTWTNISNNATIDQNGCYRLTNDIGRLNFDLFYDVEGNIVVDLQGHSIGSVYITLYSPKQINLYMYNGVIEEISTYPSECESDNFRVFLRDLNIGPGCLHSGPLTLINVHGNNFRVNANEYNVVNSTLEFEINNIDTGTITHAIGVLPDDNTYVGEGNYVILTPWGADPTITVDGGNLYILHFCDSNLRIEGNLPETINLVTDWEGWGNFNIYLEPSNHLNKIQVKRYVSDTFYNCAYDDIIITTEHYSDFYWYPSFSKITIYTNTNIDEIVNEQKYTGGLYFESNAFSKIVADTIKNGGGADHIELNTLKGGLLIARKYLEMSDAHVQGTIKGTEETMVDATKITMSYGLKLDDVPLADYLHVYGSGTLTIDGITPSEKIVTHSDRIHVRDLTIPEPDCNSFTPIYNYTVVITEPGCYVATRRQGAYDYTYPRKIEIHTGDVYLDLNGFSLEDGITYDVNVEGNVYIVHGTSSIQATGDISNVKVNLFLYDFRTPSDMDHTHPIIANYLDIDHGSELRDVMFLYKRAHISGTVNYKFELPAPVPLKGGWVHDFFRDEMYFANSGDITLNGDYNVVYFPTTVTNIVVHDPAEALYLVTYYGSGSVRFKEEGDLADRTIIALHNTVDKLYYTADASPFRESHTISLRGFSSIGGALYNWHGQLYITDDTGGVDTLYISGLDYDTFYSVFDQSDEVTSVLTTYDFLPKRVDVDVFTQAVIGNVGLNTDENDMAYYRIHKELRKLYAQNEGAELDIYLDIGAKITAPTLNFYRLSTVKIWNPQTDGNLEIKCNIGTYPQNDINIYLYGVGDPDKITFSGSCVPHIYLHGGIEVEKYVVSGNIIKVVPNLSGGITISIRPGYSLDFDVEENRPLYLIARTPGEFEVTFQERG